MEPRLAKMKLEQPAIGLAHLNPLQGLRQAGDYEVGERFQEPGSGERGHRRLAL